MWRECLSRWLCQLCPHTCAEQAGAMRARSDLPYDQAVLPLGGRPLLTASGQGSLQATSCLPYRGLQMALEESVLPPRGAL